MKFSFNGRVLYGDGDRRPLAVLKGGLSGDKRVLSADGTLALKTTVRDREYVIISPDGTEIAVALPEYAEGENPAEKGHPVCRMPRTDRARIHSQGREFLLSLERGNGCQLWDGSKKLLARFTRRGWGRGWGIEAADRLSPELVCGVFAFCQYLERENELIVV